MAKLVFTSAAQAISQVDSITLGGTWSAGETATIKVGLKSVTYTVVTGDDSDAVAAGAQTLICSSGGNAGYAVAYAGNQLGVPVTVVVPRSTSEMMREIIRGEGATVIEHGTAWDDAHEHALGLVARYDASLLVNTVIES